MKFLNQILITIGTLAVLVVTVYFWFAIQSSHFEAKSKVFATEYVSRFSKEWNVADVETETASEMISLVSSGEGKEAVEIFKQFGELREISDFEPVHTTVSVGSTHAIYQFKALFENTKAIGLIEIIEIEGRLRAKGLRFSIMQPLPTKPSSYGA